MPKVKFILFTLFLLLLYPFIKPSPVKAEEILFQDDFNRSEIGDNWEIKNFTLEDSGSFGPYYELTLLPTGELINIFGTRSLNNNEVWVDDMWVGWIGRSLVTKDHIELKGVIDIQSSVRIVDASGEFAVSLLIEFDSNNRIVFNLGRAIPPGMFVNLTFDENNTHSCGHPGCTSTPYPYIIGDYVDMRLSFNSDDKTVKAFINNIQVLEDTYDGFINNPKVGFSSNARYIGNSINSTFDNFVLIGEPQTQSGSVPDIKQYSPPWEDDEYDSASNWYPSNNTIKRWGCALTSAAMLLQYHGFNIDPGELNTWLKSRDDGYTRAGGIMWTAITKYSKEHLSGSLKSLEFTYSAPSNNLITSELESSRPPILKMQKPNGNTHFIVATDESGDDNFFVNDPASPTNTLYSEAVTQWGTNSKIGIFTPSDTDLSYIVLFIDDGFTLKVYDPNGIYIGEGYEEEYPIQDSIDENNVLGNKLNAFYLPKPENGIYRVEVVGNGNYQLDSYLYDTEANPIIDNLKDNTNNNDENMYLIHFDKNSSEKTHIEKIGFSELLSYIKNAYKTKNITKYWYYYWLKRQITLSQKFYNRGHIMVAKRILINVTRRIKHTPVKIMNLETRQLILNNIESLVSTF